MGLLRRVFLLYEISVRLSISDSGFVGTCGAARNFSRRGFDVHATPRVGDLGTVASAGTDDDPRTVRVVCRGRMRDYSAPSPRSMKVDRVKSDLVGLSWTRRNG